MRISDWSSDVCSSDLIDQQPEGPGAVADRMLLLRRHLAEAAQLAAFHLALRHEHRIVAEAVNATRPPDEAAGDDAFEGFDMAVRPSQAERTDELGANRRPGALVLHRAPDQIGRATVGTPVTNAQLV